MLPFARGSEGRAGDIHALLERPHELAELDVPALALLLGRDGEVANDRAEDANRREEEGELDALGANVRLGDGEGRRGDDGACLRSRERGGMKNERNGLGLGWGEKWARV